MCLASPIFLHVGVFLSYIAATHAFTTFDITCTNPSISYNYVTSEASRSTLDILWSCLFTILACTWTIQHPNIPEQRNGRNPGFWGDLLWRWKSIWSTLQMMLVAIIAPEYTFGKAVGDFASARSSRKKMEDFARGDGVKWTLAHSFYADMGGFRVIPAGHPDTAEDHSSKASAREIVLVSSDLHWLRRKGDIAALPDISESEIQDKSKGDGLVKTIALFQVLWMALQVIIRRSKGLAISQLELAVTAYSVCAVITYLFLLQKPKNIGISSRPLECNASGIASRRNASSAEDRIDYYDHELLIDILVPGAFARTSKSRWFTSRVPNETINGECQYIVCYGAIVGGLIFGGIHIAAWNFEFPTYIEQLLWRICSVGMVTLMLVSLLPLVATVFALLVFDADIDENDAVIAFNHSIYGLCAVLYVLVRLFILVETFRTLFYLPPDAFTSTWASSSVPHVG
jgi:hypothetical protein